MRRLVLLCLFLGLFGLRTDDAGARPLRDRPKPTVSNVKYGEHERNTIDFWKAEADGPTPLLIYFHGGGFKKGDKSAIHHRMDVGEWLRKGVSCASVNYPFLEHRNNDYRAIMKECEQAVAFIAGKSEEWEFDKSRIACSGSSAGALITEWVGSRTKLISVGAVFMQPKGTFLLAISQLHKGSPPLFIYQASPETDQTHHPKYARQLKDACDAKGVTCELWGTGSNGIDKLPDGKTPGEEIMRFFVEQWNAKKKAR